MVWGVRLTSNLHAKQSPRVDFPHWRVLVIHEPFATDIPEQLCVGSDVFQVRATTGLRWLWSLLDVVAKQHQPDTVGQTTEETGVLFGLEPCTPGR